MGMHVVIQPLAGYGAEVVSPSPGVVQLIAGGEDAAFLVQVPARVGGLSDAARFARRLAAAASEFGECCEAQNRARSFPLVDQWPDGRFSQEQE
ncbi:hypothetical protein [Amycolatopsis sp.]|uniref:hypothetical protein n=1 Tax=Amycolatopsis sp. TaxID=37632 RepID=UPI002C83F982|nr:hypothetical protein [Amycolatopsis sp.]HVV11809.1 hypothetical protein [Amycolatopsis sp.]